MTDSLLIQPAPGFQGVWYANQKTDPPYHWKYSGGLATYPQQHAPIAIYREDVRRTYFVFGGRGDRPAQADYHPGDGKGEEPGDTACCVSYFDHTTGKLARPFTLVTRDVIDAHENPVICIDDAGHVIVFCPAHGSKRPSYIFRTAKPHDIASFELVRTFEPGDNFSYPQPWWIAGEGLVFLHTFYEDGSRRRLGVTRSADGIDWPEWSDKPFLSKIAQGSYQISWPGPDGLLATAFDMHPAVAGDTPLNFRTNIYYAQSRDGGRSWQTATGEAIEMPLTAVDNPARVFDGEAAGVLVYLKDLQFDEAGQPVLLYLTSRSAWPGPENGPHAWHLAGFDRESGSWLHHDITASDHNYDHGSLMLRSENDWRLIAPTHPGPQKFATGGAMGLWRSSDRGATWAYAKTLIADEKFNHTYARRPLHAHDDFAMLWAAADAHVPSDVSLYFCNADGDVFRMPEQVEEDFASPIALKP